MRGRVLALAGAIVVLAAPLGQAQRQVFAVALPDGPASCMAVADATKVSVRALDGRELWQWSYAKGSRYIAPAAIAVSQACDAVALVGDSGYKYSWVVRKTGRAAAVSGSGTPLSAAFDTTGTRVAIGTAAGRVLLVGADAQRLWTTDVSEHAPIVRGLRFSSHGNVVITDGGAVVVDTSGRVVWGQWATGTALARNHSRMVAWQQPPHGPGYGVVQLVDMTSGKELWLKPVYSGAPEALLSRDGSLVAIWVNRNQTVDPAADFVPDPPMDLCLLDSAGRVVKRLDAKPGRLIAGTADLGRLLLDSRDGIVEVSANGGTRVVVDRETLGYDGVVVVADDYSGLVIGQRSSPDGVQWVSLL